jgi:hypothetical protein
VAVAATRGAAGKRAVPWARRTSPLVSVKPPANPY